MRRRSDPLAIEQYADYFTGRTLRWSLLAKAPAAGGPDWRQLAGLHSAGDIHCDASAAAPVFKDRRGRAISADDPSLARALASLAEAKPETLPFAQLNETSGGAELGAALGRLARVGQIELLSSPYRVGRASDPRPQVWPLRGWKPPSANPG